VGLTVGAVVGEKLGSGVGFCMAKVGCLVGRRVGALDGEALGSGVGNWPMR